MTKSANFSTREYVENCKTANFCPRESKCNYSMTTKSYATNVKTFVNPDYQFDSIKTAGSNYVKKVSSTYLPPTPSQAPPRQPASVT